MHTHVWCLLTEKKREKCRFPALLDASTGHPITFHELSSPEDAIKRLHALVMEAGGAGARHILLHKVTDYFKEAEEEGVDLEVGVGRDVIGRLQGVVGSLRDAGVQVEVINSLEGIQVIADRWRTCQLLASALPPGISIPATRLYPFHADETIMPHPLIWKPVAACGTPASHSLLFLKDEASLPSAEAGVEGIVQRYVRHAGILYKIFVVGDRVEVVIRPSISEGHFEGGDVGPQPFDSPFVRALRPLSSADMERAREGLRPHMELVKVTSRWLAEALGLRLFGWDMIVGEEDGRPYIIDVNNFPKCDGFPNLPQALLHLLLHKH